MNEAPLRVIPVDLHAIRMGEEAVGWIIVFGVAEGETHSDVNNKLFPTLEAANAHALTVAECWKPKIKALRAAEEKP